MTHSDKTPTAPLEIYDLLTRVRERQPVIHHLTNWVTIYDCAQVVKTLGGSPVMAHAPEEVAEMAQIASALVLNIGTLTTDLVDSMKLALQSANRNGIPVLLDACGVGATQLRNQKCLELLEAGKVDIVKGNASEIAWLAGANAQTRGVDAGTVLGDLGVLARNLSAAEQATVVVTGKTDLVTGAGDMWHVDNGHEMMTRVVGTGCMVASVIASFAAVESNYPRAAAAALSCYGIAAEIAASKAAGPATFKEKLFDALFLLDRDTCERMQRVSRVS